MQNLKSISNDEYTLFKALCRNRNIDNQKMQFYIKDILKLNIMLRRHKFHIYLFFFKFEYCKIKNIENTRSN